MRHRRCSRWLLGILLAIAAPVSEGAARDYDWCAPVVVRPDQRRQEGDRCIGRWTDEEIADGAEVVMLGGFTDVAEPRFVHLQGQCGPPERHRDIGKYVERLRMLRAARGGPPLFVIHENRFDIVADTQAALPGFDADFLLRTDRPWQEVLDFFQKDRSIGCPVSGCRWSDSMFGHEGREAGPRLRDSIDKVGGRDRYQTVVYNTPAPSANEPVFYPLAALADLRNPKYRAWRVAEAVRAMRDGGYDAIALNQKFTNLIGKVRTIGDEEARDVAAARKSNPFWTAKPIDYRFADYAAGWVALGKELRAAGVPYAISDLPAYPWFERWDDPSSPVNEWQEIRPILFDAKLVMLERGKWGGPSNFDALVAELRAKGVKVVLVEVGCGQKWRS